MLSLACHQCQCLRGKYQCRRCFYILTIKAAYHHGSLKGLEMTHWRKVEKIRQHFLRFKESRPTICLQCWASGEGHFHYSRIVGGQTCCFDWSVKPLGYCDFLLTSVCEVCLLYLYDCILKSLMLELHMCSDIIIGESNALLHCYRSILSFMFFWHSH